MSKTWPRAPHEHSARRFAAIAVLLATALAYVPQAAATPFPFEREFQFTPFISSIVHPPAQLPQLRLMPMPKYPRLPHLPPLVNARDLKCLATALYFEARGEPTDGNVAVAQVILNRVKAGRWRNTICGVVNQGRERGSGCQFSYACARYKQPAARDKLWLRAVAIARDVMTNKVTLKPYERSTYFHATYVSPSWSHSFKRSGRIGRHIFYETIERPVLARRGSRRQVG